MRAINFNSVGSASFGLRVNGVNVFNGAAKEIQSYNVPGRPGTIIPANPVEVYNHKFHTHGLHKRFLKQNCVPLLHHLPVPLLQNYT